jgi:peptidoglycan/xylan/chitin deacetylase (PgdA/CDA1 family)
MKDFIVEALCLAVRASLVPWFMREVYARHKVTIVNYHDPKPALFARHLLFLKRHYSILSLDRLADALHSGDWVSLPPKSLVITFDDGHAGNAELAPILKENGVNVTIYAVARPVGSKGKFWFNFLRDSTSSSHVAQYIDMPDHERRQQLSELFGFTEKQEYDRGDGLSREALVTLTQAGATFGSHADSHPNLTRCNEETAKRELSDSKIKLETETGKPIIHFAYPWGYWNDEIAQWARDAGYKTARTTTPGWATRSTNPYALPNFGVSDNAGTSRAVVQVAGLWNLLLKAFGK